MFNILLTLDKNNVRENLVVNKSVLVDILHNLRDYYIQETKCWRRVLVTLSVAQANFFILQAK